MVENAIRAYQAGAITEYQLMMDCLHAIDPSAPQLVLNQLPAIILDEMLSYAGRYDPSRRWVGSVNPPTEDQIRAAETWIQKHRPERSEIGRP